MNRPQLTPAILRNNCTINDRLQKQYPKSNRRKANWIGHILPRSCLFKHVIEGKIEEIIELVGNRRRRRKQLLDNIEEKTGCRKLKTEALHRSTWWTRFGRGCGPVVRQAAGWMNISKSSERGKCLSLWECSSETGVNEWGWQVACWHSNVGCDVEVNDVDVTQYLVKMCVLIIVYIVGESFGKLFGSGFHKFKKKSNRNLKTLGARRMTCSKVSAEGRQISDLKIQDVVPTAICHWGFVYL